MADRWIVAAAAAVAVGAWWAPAVSWWWGAAAAAVGLVSRARVLIPVGLLVLGAAGMGHQAAVLATAPDGSFDVEASIISDPRWRSGALVVPFAATISGRQHRWEGRARAEPAWQLQDAAVGQRWHLAGTATAAERDDRPFLWPRHLAGNAQIRQARLVDAGGAPFRFANSLRDLVERSAASLSKRDASLLAGFVYGDDRGQLPEVVHDFRATSLTHLLAVSGSNVAFVLLLFSPLLVRLRPIARLGAVAVLLAQFAVITRAEPSVLRACVLATLAVGAIAVGRRASAARLLALAVIVLVLIDPLLVRSVGFQLSVAATAAIVAGAGRLAPLLWGPAWLRLALAATLTAQAGVLPVQLAVFGSLPLVSIPANVLAAPMAGPAMVWGLVTGVVGGLAGDAVAAILHLPTRAMLGWVAAVARWGAALGWPQIEPAEVAAVAALAGACAVGVFVARSRPAALRLAVIVVAAVGIWLVAGTHRPALPSSAHVSVHSTDPTIVIVDRPDAARALGQLAAAGVRDIDVLVARSASRVGREAVRAVAARHAIGRVLAPSRLGGTVPYAAVRAPMTVGALQIVPSSERLDVSADVPARPAP